MATLEEVRDFLRSLKKILADPKCMKTLERRRVNDITLEDLGYRFLDVKNELISLTVQEYMTGPTEHHDTNKDGEVWEFGKRIQERDIYIKLHIYQAGTLDALVCISFHFSDQPLKFPYHCM